MAGSANHMHAQDLGHIQDPGQSLREHSPPPLWLLTPVMLNYLYCIFHSLEAGIPNAISTFKWRKIYQGRS